MEYNTRPPAVAGTFYPQQTDALRQMVRSLLQQVAVERPLPRAIVAPHAGYVYSGYTAAHAYRTLPNDWAAVSNQTASPRRVFLIGPSHRVYLEGVSVGNYHRFLTPLGTIDVDWELINRMVANEPDVTNHPAPHQLEHSLEVHLPFLQETIGSGGYRLVPMVFGRMPPQRLAEIIDRYRQPDDLLIYSSDLSHFLPYEAARTKDQQCHQAMLARDPSAMAQCDACGNTGMAALLHLAQQQRWQVTLADYRTSGDTAGDKQRVVGYASYLCYDEPASCSLRG
ncbi:MAG: AmmeMemoRadiSam system protein B [Magnetococcales bacterium]|nr:AmmeMemoRadiSam system protein B [Magnetococcales bacterium]